MLAFEGSLFCVSSHKRNKGESLLKGFPHLAHWFYFRLSSSVLCCVTLLCCYDRPLASEAWGRKGWFCLAVWGHIVHKAGKARWQAVPQWWELVARTPQFFTSQCSRKQRTKNSDFLFFPFFPFLTFFFLSLRSQIIVGIADLNNITSFYS